MAGIPKLARALAAGVRGEPTIEAFATLDFYCDWGLAEEYMDIAIDCLERAPTEDFVMATGRCLHARELVGRLAEEYALGQPAWMDNSSALPGQSPYQVQMTKLRNCVGRVPQTSIEALVGVLVRRELGGSDLAGCIRGSEGAAR